MNGGEGVDVLLFRGWGDVLLLGGGGRVVLGQTKAS